MDYYEKQYRQDQYDLRIESFDLQIDLSLIIDDQKEYSKLIKKKREFILNYLLNDDIIDDELEYFE